MKSLLEQELAVTKNELTTVSKDLDRPENLLKQATKSTI